MYATSSERYGRSTVLRSVLLAALLTLLLPPLGSLLLAQSSTRAGIEGRVVDLDGEPLLGVTITIEADDSMQYTLGVGGNYFINSHWAMDFEIRYLLMEQDIKIDVSGYDQLNYRYRSPENLLGCGNRLLFPDELFPPDFDRFNRGIVDLCRPSNAFPFSDQVLVQGGTINLSSWVFRFGVRYVF